ncbi:hypothetical protein DICPUDRAFT_147287 [Dictyostelium purpureum]|uniref:F-box domain-containing protein n=1 Tax=Dictyostelium purpureum TaxID=5786 RepID=F0Z842_DICPU|nr:uncharacterized protein DICPUDRAFT_147287 [Dictyostelium purpureum]EGC39864.1 hypothetical protein DICPUDRAFT_147287 [Dictyostelium purpureum]|eukprot:XP_003283615.1 hypothetical protein DICPUDRAFT_147287 [Dictyostelium purpureum]
MEERFNNESLEEFLNRPGDYENERRNSNSSGGRRRRRRGGANTTSIIVGGVGDGENQMSPLTQGITVEGFIDIENDSFSSLSDYSENDNDQEISSDQSFDSDSDLDIDFTASPDSEIKPIGMDNSFYSIHNNVFSNTFAGGELTDKQKHYQQDHIDIISNLPFEVLAYIFQSLDVRTLLNISLVSKLFYTVENSYSIWRPKCRTFNIYNRDIFTMEQSTFYTTTPKIFNNSQDRDTTTTTTTTSTSPNGYESPPILSNNSTTTVSDLKSSFMRARTVRFFTDDLEPISIDNDSRNQQMMNEEGKEDGFEISMCEWKKLYFELGSIKLYGSYDLVESGIESSSCDSSGQTIHNTLANNNSFWSSKGTPSAHDSEFLVYKLEQPICIVSSVKMLAYKASFQSGFPIYAPMGVVISVGFTPDHFHYRSQLFGCKHTDKPQTFKLEPELVLGGYIRVELVGKYQTQFNDKLFYHAINQICVEGVSIGSLDYKPSLSLSMLQFYSKFKDPSALVHYSTNNINQTPSIDSSVILTVDNEDGTGNGFTYHQILSKLRSYMAPKLDVERIKNHNLYTIVQDVVEGRYQEAVDNVFKNDLRGERVFNIFTQTTDNKAISTYYSALIESLKKFSTEETMFLAREAFYDGNVNIFTRLLLSGRFRPSLELGEFILMNGYPLIAAEVFSQCQILDRTIQCLYIAGCHEEALLYTRNYSADYPLDLVHFIKLNEQVTDDLNNFNDGDNNLHEGIVVEADRVGSIFGIEIQDPNDTATLITELKKLKATLNNVKPIRKYSTHSRLSEFFNRFTQISIPSMVPN